MRELTFDEMEFVGGGVALTGISAGLKVAGVVGAAVTAWQVGYWVGTQINKGINVYVKYYTYGANFSYYNC